MINILTYQDYDKAPDKALFIIKAINEYLSSYFYQKAIEAEQYFKGENTAILNRPKWTMKKTGKQITFSQNITISNFFFRFVVQLNQYLLANGLQLKDQTQKNKLGFGFDKTLEAIGEKSLVHGSCWGYWNLDHLEMFKTTEFFALLDERTSEPMVGVRFWQIDPEKPMNVHVFETDGVTEYIKDNDTLTIYKEKRSYKQEVRSDAISTEITKASNYGVLPIIPLYANEYRRSEFTPNIKTKIDMYDKIFSDFGDNLERTNDIYWAITNFGGTTNEIREMLAEIEELRAVFARGDGSHNTTAEPHTIEVPYAARQTALDLLERALYADSMSMNMNEITGGSLTNVAIDTAKANLSLKANRFEWQVFQFCQKILNLVEVKTEDIKFRRQTIANATENINNVLNIYREGLFDKRTALEKMDGDIVASDEIDTIMDRLAMEDLGIPPDDTTVDEEPPPDKVV